MARFFDVQITNDSPDGLYSVYYLENGIENYASLIDTYEVATNLSKATMVVGVRVLVPDSVDKVILKFVLNEETYVCGENEIFNNCIVYFTTYDDLLYKYDPRTNTNTELYDLSTLSIPTTRFAMTESQMMFLHNDEIHVYDITLTPFTMTHNVTYTETKLSDNSVTNITATSNNKLYGGFSALNVVTLGVVPALSSVTVDKISDFKSNGGFNHVDSIYFNYESKTANPNTYTFLALGTEVVVDPTFVTNYYVYEYDYYGNIINSIDYTNDIVNPGNVRFLYSNDGEIYLVKDSGETYKIDKDTSITSYSHTIPNIQGNTAHSTQLGVYCDLTLSNYNPIYL